VVLTSVYCPLKSPIGGRRGIKIDRSHRTWCCHSSAEILPSLQRFNLSFEVEFHIPEYTMYGWEWLLFQTSSPSLNVNLKSSLVVQVGYLQCIKDLHWLSSYLGLRVNGSILQTLYNMTTAARLKLCNLLFSSNFNIL
jgi:hypothetical protein